MEQFKCDVSILSEKHRDVKNKCSKLFLFKEDTFVFVLDTRSILFWINVFRLYEQFQRFNMVCTYFNNYIVKKYI